MRLRVVGNREQLVAMMEACDVDLSAMGRPRKEIATRAEAFAAHPLVLVCPPQHPLLKVGHAPVSALDGYAFIVREHGSGTRTAMEAFFTEHRFEPRITMEMSSNETIKQAVMAGMGLSFMPLQTMGLHLQSRLLSPAAEAFRYFIIERGEAHLLAHDAPLLKRASGAGIG